MISMYDQEYGQRRGQISGNRAWDKHRLSWVPEASDDPVSGIKLLYDLALAIFVSVF